MKVKGKGKVVPVLLIEHYTMNVYWGSGGIPPHILGLDQGEWSASHPGCFTPQEKNSQYPLDRRLG
jgi:hypothetical protein